MDTAGFRVIKDLLMGYPELRWQQTELHDILQRTLAGGAYEAGWAGGHVGPNPDYGWEVYDSGSGVLAIRDTASDGTPLHFGRVRPSTSRGIVGVDPEGHLLQVPAGSTLYDDTEVNITVPNDGTWYTLVARYGLRTREPGTLTLTGGSVSVVGVGTFFTRYTDGSVTGIPADLVRVDSDDSLSGNEGTYKIDTITDDTHLTLVSAPPASESGVDFRIRGRFINTTPADPDYHWNPVVFWELVSRTTTRPADGLIAYDVKRSGGTTTVIDRRHASRFRRLDGRNRSVTLLPASWKYSNVDTAPGGGPADATSLTYVQSMTFASAAGADAQMIAMSLAPCAVGSHLSGLASDRPVGMMLAGLWDNGTNRSIRIWHHTPQTTANGASPVAGAWGNPDGGSAVNPVSAVSGVLDCHLLALPAASGNTHVLLYVTSAGALVKRFTTDNGATWGSEIAVWTVALGVTISKVSACLTRMGKVVVACAVSGGNRIRYIYSNDWAGTFDTNASAGYSSSVTGEAVTDLAVVECDDCNLWTVAAVASTNDLRLYHGQAEGNPVAGTHEQSAGWPVGVEGAGLSHLDAFPTADGTIGVVMGDTGGNGTVLYAQIARRELLHQQVLVQSANSAPLNTGTAIAVACGISAGGHLHVVTSNAYVTGGGTSYHLHARHIPYAPVAIDRPALWFGGA